MATKSVAGATSSHPTYSLTRKGRDLLRVMLEITRWSGKYDPQTNADPAVLAALERDADAFVQSIESQWATAGEEERDEE